MQTLFPRGIFQIQIQHQRYAKRDKRVRQKIKIACRHAERQEKQPRMLFNGVGITQQKSATARHNQETGRILQAKACGWGRQRTKQNYEREQQIPELPPRQKIRNPQHKAELNEHIQPQNVLVIKQQQKRAQDGVLPLPVAGIRAVSSITIGGESGGELGVRPVQCLI